MAKCTLEIKGCFLIYFIDDKLEIFSFSSFFLPAHLTFTNENSQGSYSLRGTHQGIS